MSKLLNIREKQANKKWHKLTQTLDKRIQEVQQENKTEKSRFLYEDILSDIQKIEHIENILIAQKQKLEQASAIKEKLILERDLIKLDASFKFFVHLVNQTEVEMQQRIMNFFTGIDNINATLLYLGENIYSLEIQKLEQCIRNLYTFLQVWKSLSEKVSSEQILELHEDSLKLVYASLYILEHTYNYRIKEKDRQESQNNNISWDEEQYYNQLLEDMENWSQEDWTEEEQKAFERAMSNLN